MFPSRCKKMDAYISSETDVTAPLSDDMQTHLSDCSSCRKRWQAVSSATTFLRRSVDDSSQLALDETEVRRSLMDGLRSETPRRPRRDLLRLAAISLVLSLIALLCVLAVLMIERPIQRPYSASGPSVDDPKNKAKKKEKNPPGPAQKDIRAPR